MITFSQRMGLSEIKTTIQTNDLDQPTRNALWNIVGPFFQNYASSCSVYQDIWAELYHQTSDTFPKATAMSSYRDDNFYAYYKRVITNEKWNECMDLIQFMNQEEYISKWNYEIDPCCQEGYVPLPSKYNEVFKQYLVGFRIINYQIVPVSNDEEKDAIEEAALKSPDSVAEQISKAIRSLADRRNPDCATSIKCSISAVEAQCRILLNDPTPTLGKALNQLEAKGVPLHGALKEGFKSLYGFTSDANGIRHAGLAPSDVDADLAKFMLVACSAFVNYLRSKE